MKPIERKRFRHLRRKKHVRKRLEGTPERPRLTVFRSCANVYAQIIDDQAGRTLVAASTREKDVAAKLTASGGNKAAAKIVGESLAAKALDAGIQRVVFDRNGYPYHGRVRELAEAARAGGLKF